MFKGKEMSGIFTLKFRRLPPLTIYGGKVNYTPELETKEDFVARNGVSSCGSGP